MENFTNKIKEILNKNLITTVATTTALKVLFTKFIKKKKELAISDIKGKRIESYFDYMSFLEFLSSDVLVDLWNQSQIRKDIFKQFAGVSTLAVQFATIYIFKLLYINKFKIGKLTRKPSLFDTYVDMMYIYSSKIFLSPIVNSFIGGENKQ